MHAPPDWDPALAQEGPAFAPYRDLVRALPATRWPGPAELEPLLRAAHPPACVHGGVPVRLVSAGASAYERHLHDTGEVQHRAQCWHDLLNALVWARFPRAKAALNAAHVAAYQDGARGPRRDALTLFDESGLLVVSEQAPLLELLRRFRWRELLWDRRAALARHADCLAFGHALLEKLLAPYPSITAHCLLLVVEPGWCELPAEARWQAADARLAQLLARAPQQPADLSPLPVLGLPGWSVLAQDPDFYARTDIFRAGRRRGGAIDSVPGGLLYSTSLLDSV